MQHVVYFWYHDVYSAKFTLGQASRLHTSYPQNGEGKSDLYLSVSGNLWARRVLSVPLGGRQTPGMSLQHSVKRKKHSFPTHCPSLRLVVWHSWLPFCWDGNPVQTVPHTLTDAAVWRKDGKVDSFLSCTCTQESKQKQLSRLHQKDDKVELQVLTMVIDKSIHQKPSKILLLRHICQMTVSLVSEWEGTWRSFSTLHLNKFVPGPGEWTRPGFKPVLCPKPMCMEWPGWNYGQWTLSPDCPVLTESQNC